MQKAIILENGGWDTKPVLDVEDLNTHLANGWRYVASIPLATSAIKNINEDANDTFAWITILMIIEKV